MDEIREKLNQIRHRSQFLLSDGGADIGTGHLERALAFIEKHLLEAQPDALLEPFLSCAPENTIDIVWKSEMRCVTANISASGPFLISGWHVDGFGFDQRLRPGDYSAELIKWARDEAASR
jgi:hypothetical protein